MMRLRSSPTAGTKKKSWSLTALTILTTLQTASLAYAAEQQDEANADVDPFALSPEQLFDATVVSVSKTPEKLGNAPAAIFVLTSEDIRRSGATSIAEALRLVPGVQVARGNTSSWAISVRGFNSALSNKLLVLMDGREVYDPLFSGVYWDIQDTPLADIDRIEVIRGPGASLWGANAVNGVINIITKKASETLGSLVSVVAGNEERAIATARHGATLDDGAHVRVFGKYLDRDSQERLSGSDAEDEWRAWRGGFRADWDKNAEGDAFTFQGDVYKSKSGRFRAVPQLTAPYAVIQEENVTAEGQSLLGRWSRELQDGASFSLQAYLDHTVREQLTLDVERTTFDVEAQYDFPSWGDHEVIAGARYRYSADKLTATPIITFADSSRRDQLISGFVQDKITLEPERWYLTIGSKFEHNDYSGFEIQPNVRLQWLGESGEVAWASISRAVRTPSRLEHDLRILAGVIPPGVLPVSVELVPSPSFESEELIAYEVGYRQEMTPTVLVDIAAFFNDYDKLMTLSLAPPSIGGPPPHFILPIQMTNLTDGEAYGFEATVNWRVADNVNVSASYSFVDLQLHGPPSNQAIASEAAEGQSPEHQFTLRGQWDVSETLAFDTTLYFVDELPAYRIDSYWRLDTRLGWRVTDEIQVEVVGQNLLDNSHREFGSSTDVGSTEIGRSLFGRITWRH